MARLPHKDPPPPIAPSGAFSPYPLPAKDFDPARATDDELERHGLPRLSAFDGSPAAAAFRQTFLQGRADAPPMSFLAAMEPHIAAAPTGTIPLAAQASWPAQKSMNWSGAYVAPRNGRSLVSVMANWTVPAVSPPPGGTASEYQSSTWIGLDGQRLYLDSSLPQIGTRQRWLTHPTPRAEYGCWFQWWARGRDLPIVTLALPVDPYDEISAIITVLSETTVRCNLKNVSKNIALQAFDATAPAGLRISGATAEWIMERPSPMGTDGWEPYELPAYTDFAFTDCVAQSVAPGSSILQGYDLASARLIRMYELRHNPAGARTISTARRILDAPQRLELSYLAP